MSAPTGHARFSPSAAGRWLACPGSLTLLKAFQETPEGARALAEDTSSEASRKGTAAHAIAAWAVEHGGYSARGFPEGILDIDLLELVDAELIALVDDAVACVRDMVSAYSHGVPARVLIESQIDLSSILQVPDQFGTADVVILSGDLETLSVQDHKFGYVYVSAVRNSQLMLYALGALATLGERARGVRQVELVIHQPRVSDIPDVWRTSVAELLNFQSHVRDVVALIQYNDVRGVTMHDLHPSDDACQWCPIQARCPARLNEIDLMLEQLTGLPVGADEDRRHALEDARRIMSAFADDQLDRLFPMLDMMDVFTSAVRDELRTRLQAGRTFEHCKLVEGRAGPRKWIDPDAVAEKLLQFYPRDTVYTEAVVSPTEAEKRWKKEPAWGQIAPFITRSDPKPQLVPQQDKRAPLEPLSFDDHTKE